MISSRRLLATAYWILAICTVLGCALPQGGRLPKAELPTVPPVAEPKPSLSFQISFLPPGSEKEPTLIEEFIQEFESSHLFGTIVQATIAGDIRMKIVLTQACAATSKDFALYLATGGLSPIHVPCEYELQSEIHGRSGKYGEYEVRDKASSLVLAPGWPPGVDWSIDPTSSDVRRNMYRALMVKMREDGIIGVSADMPRH